MNTPIEDGGAAFPITRDQYSGSALCGMSLRDYFAGQALAGIAEQVIEDHSCEWIASASFALADAMLAARKEAK